MNQKASDGSGGSPFKGFDLPELLDKASKVNSIYAVAALAIVAVIALVVFGLAKLTVLTFDSNQALILAVVLLLALVAIVLSVAWRQVTTQSQGTGLTGIDKAAVVIAPELRPPNRDKRGILLDLSHRQSEWSRSRPSVFKLSTPTYLYRVVPAQEDQKWDIIDIADSKQITEQNLRPWPGLILGLPYHSQLTDFACDEIVRWVHEGGRLALLGYELGDRHHESNLNKLADRFGIRFNSDIVAPPGWSGGKPYGSQVVIEVDQSASPFEGVQSLCLRNVCTLSHEPGATVLAHVGRNTLCRLTAQAGLYDSAGWLRGGNQEFEMIEQASWIPLMTTAPKGLVGEGEVLALGTWDVVGSADGFEADNKRFLSEILSWLTSRQ
jgi:hypothetical protein